MGELSKNGADKYFKVGSHPAAELWNAADDDERNAAVTFARSQLERAKAGPLTAPANGTLNYGVREDEALYEQAFHVLTHNPFRANAEQTAVTWDLTEASGEGRTQEAMDTLCDRAVRKMGWWPLRIVRG